MKKMIIVFACMILISSFGLAQTITNNIKKPNSLTTDIYIPTDIIQMPRTPSPLIKDLDAPVTSFRSQNGASKNYSEHLMSCREHRNYDFKTKKWNQVPALPEWKCTELWGLYLLTKQKIGYNPINTPLYNKEVMP